MNVVETGYVSLKKYGEELCGDCVEIVNRNKSVTMVLADGLGSGVKANILSTLTSKILGTMMANGLKIEDAVQTVAQTLPVCSIRKIAYSTFSVLQVKPDGEAYLVQYDNPRAILLSASGSVEFPQKEIDFAGKKIYESRMKLKAGDMLLLISDGVVHAGADRIYNMGWQWEQVCRFVEERYTAETTAKEMASLLAGACRQLYLGKPGDDATVAALKMREKRCASVMIGPPADPAKDTEMVDSLMAGDGLKAICGGTTAQIAARRLNREIVPICAAEGDTVPPASTIQGIDLVTEGALTIQKSLAYIANYSVPDEEDPLFARGEDGAAKLARLLLNDCTDIRFLIGTAVNPAYVNPDFPSSFCRKTDLVEKLAKSLKQCGKEVSLQYF